MTRLHKNKNLLPVALIVLLSLAAIVIIQRQEKPLQKILPHSAPQTAQKTSTPSLAQTEILITQSIVNPQGQFVIRPMFTKQSDSAYQMDLILLPKEDSIYLYKGNNLSRSSNSIWSSTHSKQYLEAIQTLDKNRSREEQTERQFLIWSPSGTKIAVMLPEKIVILSFTFESDTANHAYNVYLKETKEIDLKDITIPTQEFPQFFFSGDESQLYIPQKNELYTLIEDFTKIEKTALDASNLYPIPSSQGYTYFKEKTEYDHASGTQYNLFLKTPQKKEDTYPLPITFDYPGKILLSPERDKVCFENGNSGYWGYAVYKLKTMEKIITGGHYSYCMKWIDNETLLLKEKPYDNQSHLFFYLFNTKSLSKTLLFTEEIKDE